MSDEFRDRRVALEEVFFAEEDAKLRRRLREADEAKSRKHALTAASGITDDAVLEKLAALNLGSDTVTALALVPLVAVAWADGRIDDRERAAVLSAAAEAGMGGQDAAHQLLDRWLREAPPPELLAAWTDYIRSVSAALDGDARQVFKADLLGRARRVAEATRGFLGFGPKVSPSEEAALERLERAFST